MSRPSGPNTPLGGARPPMGSSGGSGIGQGSVGKGRANSQQPQRSFQSNAVTPRPPGGQQPAANSAPGSQSSRNASPAPNNAHNHKSAAQKPSVSRTDSNDAGAPQSTKIVEELNGLLSQPVMLTLDGGRQQEAGLLWAVDASMGTVALEVPKTAVAGLVESSSVSRAYPSTAAAYPTAMLAGVKVAAQGGDSSGTRTNFTLVKIDRIQRVETLARQTPAAQALSAAKPTLVDRDVNVAAADAREKAATAEALKRASKIGVGVSKLGQDVFDALNKTLPCRWADQHIIVMDEIVISPDKYDEAAIPGLSVAMLQTLADGGSVANAPADAKSKATRWQRVAKVLAGERRRITESAVA